MIEYHPKDIPAFTLVNDFPNSFITPDKDVFKLEIDEKQRIWYHANRDTSLIYTDDSGAYIEQETLFKPYNRPGTRGLAYFDNAIWFGVANDSIYRLAEESVLNTPKAAPLAIQFVSVLHLLIIHLHLKQAIVRNF